MQNASFLNPRQMYILFFKTLAMLSVYFYKKENITKKNRLFQQTKKQKYAVHLAKYDDLLFC